MNGRAPEPALQFGPPGLVHFSKAVSIFSIEPREQAHDVAVAVDDGTRSVHLIVRTAPETQPVRVPLAPVKFTHGQVTYAVARVPAGSRSAALYFFDAGGKLVEELSCQLDLVARTLTPQTRSMQPRSEELPELAAAPPQAVEEAPAVKDLWPSFGPRGTISMRRAVNAVRVDAGTIEIVLDDGGTCEAVACTFSQAETRRVTLLRATPRSPAWFELSWPRHSDRIGFYFLGPDREKTEPFDCAFDVPAKSFVPVRADGRPSDVVRASRVVCLACRNDKSIEDCTPVTTLPEELQRLIRRDFAVTFEFNLICRVCSDKVRAESDTFAAQLRQLQHVVRFLAVFALFFKCWIGALADCFPHGAVTHYLLTDNLGFLKLFNLPEARIASIALFVNQLLWAALFSAIPFHTVATLWLRFFLGMAQSNPVSLIAALLTQFFLLFGAWLYGGLFTRPIWIPAERSILLWQQPYLAALLAALLHAILSDALADALGKFDLEWKRRSQKARRGDVLLGQFHRLLRCHEEKELWGALREILADTFGVSEYQIWFYNETEKAFFPAVAVGSRLEDLRTIRVARGDPHFLGHAGLFNEVYGEHTLKQRRDVRHAFRRPPVRSQLAGPIRIDGEIRGIVNIGRFTRGFYDEQDLEHFTTLVSILGVAVKNAEVYTAKEKELVSSKEEVQKQILEKEFLKSMFGKYVSRALVEKILAEPKYAKLLAENAELTVLFTDLAGFTTISERMEDPTQVAELLNEYLTEMTQIIFEHFGTLDKYMGDGIMAFFGRPVELHDHAQKACLAAIDMRRRVGEIRGRIYEQTGAELKVRMGLHTGRVVVGNMGSKMAFGYTVIGDNVNLAARLEPTNKEYGTSCLISEATYERVRGIVVARPIDRIRVKGKQKPLLVYELVDRVEVGVSPQRERLIALYARGLEDYFASRFDEAAVTFGRAFELDPSDGPTRVMLDRLHEFQRHAPGPDWDGVFDVKTK